MRRFTSFVVGALALAAPAVPVAPVAANTDACVLNGSLTTATRLLEPLFGSTLTTFAIPASSMFCVTKGTSATGVVHGYCSLNTARGMTSAGHNFSWIGIGRQIVFFLDLTGVAELVERPVPLLNSCLGTTGALEFLIEGAAALTHGL